MSYTTTTTKQAGLSKGNDRETITLSADSPELANAGETQALQGCEAQECQARELHAEWQGLRRKSIEVAIQLGRILEDLKAQLKQASPKRRWEAYVRDHLGIEPRTARNYMRILRDASKIAGMGGVPTAEMISEMGIREALDFFAAHKKANKPIKAQKSKDDDSEAKEETGSPKAAAEPPFQLIDGSRIQRKDVNWTDGLVPFSAIESWVSQTPPDSTDKATRKTESRSQRLVIQLAADINRACGKADPSASMKLVESALEAIRTILLQSRIG